MNGINNTDLALKYSDSDLHSFLKMVFTSSKCHSTITNHITAVTMCHWQVCCSLFVILVLAVTVYGTALFYSLLSWKINLLVYCTGAHNFH